MKAAKGDQRNDTMSLVLFQGFVSHLDGKSCREMGPTVCYDVHRDVLYLFPQLFRFELPNLDLSKSLRQSGIAAGVRLKAKGNRTSHVSPDADILMKPDLEKAVVFSGCYWMIPASRASESLGML